MGKKMNKTDLLTKLYLHVDIANNGNISSSRYRKRRVLQWANWAVVDTTDIQLLIFHVINHTFVFVYFYFYFFYIYIYFFFFFSFLLCFPFFKCLHCVCVCNAHSETVFAFSLDKLITEHINLVKCVFLTFMRYSVIHVFCKV